MLDSNGMRMLAYIEQVTNITPIEKADRLEAVHINGWVCVCGKNEFHIGDVGVFFEIDSKLPEVYPFTDMKFLVDKKFKIKSQKIQGQISQGLLLPLSTFEKDETPTWLQDVKARMAKNENVLHEDLTEVLGVTYAVAADNARKAKPANKYKQMAQRRPELFQKSWAKWMMRRTWGKKIMFALFGRKKESRGGEWPIGQFPGVNKTDQERVENMPWVLNDKTPFIVTQKCDGSSATYILARKRHNYEFYVCSRNVRFMKKDQKCFYENNYYWEAAIKYGIKDKMKSYLDDNPDVTFVCWQGEICAPGIQKNPQHLTETHLFCFHMTDSKTGRFDIREAKVVWDKYNMETVPIVDIILLPDDMEEFKLQADGLYDASVCEGRMDCHREGFVYYKTTDPNFSFKNVSREYLLKHE